MNPIPYQYLTDSQVAERGEARARLIDLAMARLDLDGELADFDAMTNAELRAFIDSSRYGAPAAPQRAQIEPVKHQPSPVVLRKPARQYEPAPAAIRNLHIDKPRYRAVVWWNNRTVHLGYFDTPEAATAARDAARFRVTMGLHPRAD